VKRENIDAAFEIIDQMRTLKRSVEKLQVKGCYLCSDNSIIPLSDKTTEVIRRYALEDLEKELLRLAAALEAL
jgi:hypothetical protein